MLPLPDCLDESLCLIHLFLGVEQGLLVGSAHLVLVIAVLLYHIGEGWRYGELRNVTAVQTEGDGAVIVGIYDEVGGDLLNVSTLGFSHRRTRFRVKLPDFPLQCIQLGIIEFQSSLDLIPMLLGKFIEVVGEHLFHGLAEYASWHPLYLE